MRESRAKGSIHVERNPSPRNSSVTRKTTPREESSFPIPIPRGEKKKKKKKKKKKNSFKREQETLKQRKQVPKRQRHNGEWGRGGGQSKAESE